jgi:hypothetical protein
MNLWKITYIDDDGLVQEMEVKADKELEEKLEEFVRRKKDKI